MKDNYDFSNALPNPHAKRIIENGYYYPVFDSDGNSTMVFRSPEDIENMCCTDNDSVIPLEVRKRIRDAVSRDVKNSRSGAASVGSFERLIGDNDAHSLYLANPKKYICELERIEKQLDEIDAQSDLEETISFTIDELMEIKSGSFPQRALDFMNKHSRRHRRQAKR